MQHINKIREQIASDLRASFPGKFNLDRRETGMVVGVSERHLSNMESAGTPVLQSLRVGRKVVYQFPDVVDFLVSQRIATMKPRRGRPTKASKIAGGVQ